MFESTPPRIPHVIIIGVITVIFTVLWPWYRRYLEQKKPFADLPMPALSHWLLRHLTLVRDFAEGQRFLAIEASNEHGQTGFWLLSKPIMTVCNYKDAQLILRNEQMREHLGPYKKHIQMAFGTRNILSLSGRDWKLHRSAINKAFNRQALSDAKQATLRVLDVAIASMKRQIVSTNNASMEMLPILKMITMDIFGHVAFSTDFSCCRSLESPPVVEAFEFLNLQLTWRLENPMNLPNIFYWLPTSTNRRFRRERSILRTFVTKVIADRRRQNSKPNNHANPENDLLSILMAATVAKETVPDAQLAEQTLGDVLVSLMFAGYDTTSITLSYCLYLVSGDPEVEASCLEEMEQIKNLSKPEEMVYTAAVIRESLRLYPPDNATVRKLSKPLTLSGGFIAPAETAFFIPIWAIQRYEDVFEDPLTFRPDRWVKKDPSGTWVERSEDDLDGTIRPGIRDGFLAFSAGARSCAGYKLAMNEAVAIFAGLLQHFRFEAVLETDEIVPDLKSIVQRPQGSMLMKVYTR